MALIYVKFWNRSSILFDAGPNDLQFLKELEEYAIIDPELSRMAMDAISEHLCYLSEELVVLCLFSEKISTSEKNEIATELLQLNPEIPFRNLNANHIKFNGNINKWENIQMINFVGERSLYLFQLFDIPLNFLNVDANEWAENFDYIDAKQKISSALVCVNDATKRAISSSKSKYKKQRCKNDVSFRRSMLENYM